MICASEKRDLFQDRDVVGRMKMKSRNEVEWALERDLISLSPEYEIHKVKYLGCFIIIMTTSVVSDHVGDRTWN